jgi:hypothetical protein
MIVASCSGMLIATSLCAPSFQINNFVKDYTENSSYFRKVNLVCYMLCFVFRRHAIYLVAALDHVFFLRS